MGRVLSSVRRLLVGKLLKTFTPQRAIQEQFSVVPVPRHLATIGHQVATADAEFTVYPRTSVKGFDITGRPIAS